jgi:hypothetical protein
MVHGNKKVILLLTATLGVALIVGFWISTANTIDQAKDFAAAKPAPDLVNREQIVVAPTLSGSLLLEPLPELIFTDEGVASSDRRVVDPDIRIPRSLIPKDGIRPVYEPTFLPASEIILSRDELVIGLTINGDSRAYPISVLERREMVNDVVGGVPILATW